MGKVCTTIGWGQLLTMVGFAEGGCQRWPRK